MILLVALFASIPCLAALRDPLFTLDEGLLLVYPEQILAGDVPNRDFFTPYGPGGLSLLAAVFALVGPGVLAERTVGIVYHVAVATGVFALTRRLGAVPAVSAGCLSGLLLAPMGLGAYAWLGALALLTWSLALLDRQGAGRSVVLAGILGSLAVSFRPETAVVVLFSSMPYLGRGERWRQWGVGAMIGLAPLVIHSALGGWRLFANVAARASANGGLPIWAGGTPVILGAAATALCVGYLVWFAVRRRDPRSVSWGVASLLVLPQMLQRMDRGHVLAIACLVVPLATARALAELGAGHRLIRRFGLRPVVALGWGASAVCISLLAAQALMSVPRSSMITHRSRSIPAIDANEKLALDRLLRRVDALVPAGAKIFAGAQDMSVPTINDIRLYHLLPRHDAFAYYLELPPPVVRGSPLLDDLRRADALLLVEVPRAWSRAKIPFIPPGDDAANDLVAEEFCLAESVHAYKIMLRCRSGAERSR